MSNKAVYWFHNSWQANFVYTADSTASVCWHLHREHFSRQQIFVAIVIFACQITNRSHLCPGRVWLWQLPPTLCLGFAVECANRRRGGESCLSSVSLLNLLTADKYERLNICKSDLFVLSISSKRVWFE